MVYTFELGTNKFRIENLWLADVSLLVFCNEKEVFRVNKEHDWSTIKDYKVETAEQNLRIRATSKLFSVVIEVFDENNSPIRIEKLKTPLLSHFNRVHLSIDLPEKNVWSRLLFIIEVAALIFGLYSIMNESYIDGILLLILSISGLVKVSLK